MWPEYYGMMEPNAVKLCKTLCEEGKNGKAVMDLYPLLKQVRVLAFYFTPDNA
jgi:hypothetical protein